MKFKFNYPKLERVELENGRYYLDSNQNPVPSVTTILSNTSKASDGIAAWRNRVGDKEADRIIKQSTDIGTAVHEAIERYLNNEEWNIFESSSDGYLAQNITNKLVEIGLKGIN